MMGDFRKLRPGDRGSGRGDDKDTEIVVWCTVMVGEGGGAGVC